MPTFPLRLLVASIALAALAACAHQNDVKKDAAAGQAQQRCEAPDDTVVATFADGTKITLGELRERLNEPLTNLEKQKYETLKRGLDGFIVEKLVQAEAKKQGLTEDQYTEQEIDKKVPEPPEDEMKQLYEGAKDRLPEGTTYEQVRPQIVDFMTSEKKDELARKLFADLKKKADVKVTLPPPATAPQKRVEVEATGPSRGPANAPITLVEFSDFECPFCGRARGTVEEVLKKYGDKVRLVFRHYPLPFHPHAQKAAEASLCADDQGKFWQMHDALFDHQQALEPEQLKGYAKELGLDPAKFDACLDSGQKAAQVEKDKEAGSKAGVNGTPAFFINGLQLSGAQPQEEFEALIDQELGTTK